MKSVHLKQITKLGIPLVLGSILQILLHTMDMFFVSRLGTKYAAASAMGSSIAGVIFVFAMLISAGAVSLIARNQGMKNQAGIKKFAGVSIALAFTIGLLASIISLIFANAIISIYNPEAETFEIIYDYVSILFAFTFIVFLNTTLRSIIQSTGNTKSPLYIFGTANILNILLDYIFIVHLHMGIRGAAQATVISQILAAILMLRLVIIQIFHREIKVFFKTLCFKMSDAISVLKIGIWACIQSIARPITGMIMMRIVYEAGQDVGSAAFGIGLTLINYFFIILTGLSGAVTILVGQKIGEKNIEEAKAIVLEGIRLSYLNFFIFFIPFFLIPKVLFIPFKAEPEVVAIGVSYLRICYTAFIVVGYTFMYRGAFSGAGKTFQPMRAALTANVVVKVSLAYIVTKWLAFGVTGVFIAIATSVWVEFFMVRHAYKKDTLYHV